MEKIVEMFINLFGGITSISYGKEILIFLISMMPILELRGGILAAALLNMDPKNSFIICLIGNIIVIPMALFFLELIFKLLRKIKFFDKIITKIENKCLSKREQLDKYGYLGLLLFVGIPLPGTMDKKKSAIAAMLGVLMAGIIMMILSFGILKNIF